MVLQPKQRNIAYRCPGCGSAVIGIVGKFALHANMIRLKCSCGDEQSLDITLKDGKVRLSVPCLFCRQNHSYVVSESLFFDNDRFLLNCPYSNMDIAFIGDEDVINQELSRTEAELNMLMKNLEAEELSDIQPEDMPEAEILPDPAVYDTLRFVVKDLEAEGRLNCPCGEGPYDLRFTDSGMQVWCESCGASYDFNATSPTMAEEYLDLDEITLK
jgi:transcription elongation factor Elf1